MNTKATELLYTVSTIIIRTVTIFNLKSLLQGSCQTFSINMCTNKNPLLLLCTKKTEKNTKKGMKKEKQKLFVHLTVILSYL